MGFLTKIFGPRWSLFLTVDGDRNVYAIHENSPIRILGYFMRRFHEYGDPPPPWNINLTFNATEESIQLRKEHFTSQGTDLSPSLIALISKIDPKFDRVRASEPKVVNLLTRRTIPISVNDSLKEMMDSHKGPQAPIEQQSLFGVLDKVFARAQDEHFNAECRGPNFLRIYKNARMHRALEELDGSQGSPTQDVMQTSANSTQQRNNLRHEELAARRYARAWNSLDADCLLSSLSPSIVYSSDWMEADVIGLENVSSYLSGKISTVSNSALPSTRAVAAELGSTSDQRPCVIMYQGDLSQPASVVTFSVDGSKIGTIAMHDPATLTYVGRSIFPT